ncbi:hypothetical protein M405DRAFT_856721 [Rhizopogon salebrosus TDB-379]|nr:hypothetical protein M405DRAFT_856721 [Rhizopogon salebrosus TDB-379]
MITHIVVDGSYLRTVALTPITIYLLVRAASYLIGILSHEVHYKTACSKNVNYCYLLRTNDQATKR